MIRFALWGLAALLTATVPVLAQPKEQKLPEGVKLEKDLAYGKHERQKLDIYVPAGDGPFPVVLWIHGGGWVAGNKEKPPLMSLLEKGYVLASTNYRYSSQEAFPAQIEDCKNAVRYLRDNAKKYKLNPDKIGVGGASAGGHLSALVGLTDEVKELNGDAKTSARVQAVLDVFGPTDFMAMKLSSTDATNLVAKLLGGPIGEKEKLAKLASPTAHVTKKAPPFFILHGKKDALVPVSQSELLNDVLKKANVESTLLIIEEAGHDQRVFTKESNEKIAAFFDKHLK